MSVRPDLAVDRHGLSFEPLDLGLGGPGLLLDP